MSGTPANIDHDWKTLDICRILGYPREEYNVVIPVEELDAFGRENHWDWKCDCNESIKALVPLARDMHRALGQACYAKRDVESLGDELAYFDGCIEGMHKMLEFYQPLLRQYSVILARHVEAGHPTFPCPESSKETDEYGELEYDDELYQVIEQCEKRDRSPSLEICPPRAMPRQSKSGEQKSVLEDSKWDKLRMEPFRRVKRAELPNFET
ncbi:hypothetical protein F4604DRAFT_1676368 [Suillus subluteus]|nr:hypothetical protein F4604DRAFT_1676368 [Suillus subluteus]